MRRTFPVEFVFQIFAIVIAAILVHAAYVTVVRPLATAQLQYQQEQAKIDKNFAADPDVWIILKDYEQELEIILALWGLAIMGYKFRNLTRERRMFEAELVSISDGESILPEDARGHARALEALALENRALLLPQLFLTALNRFRMTRSIQDVSDEVGRASETYGDRLDSELSLVRYVAWAIPSIGFIGTVRGIGQAMGQANRALEGDLSGVTESLGTAFNSTLVALLLSMVLMFLLYQLQQMQEQLVHDAKARCERQLIQNLQVPARHE
ncbi:MAG: MotA/TolQ/ExbB proton channel family protein [Panacagrimonas sp.]